MTASCPGVAPARECGRPGTPGRAWLIGPSRHLLSTIAAAPGPANRPGRPGRPSPETCAAPPRYSLPSTDCEGKMKVSLFRSPRLMSASLLPLLLAAFAAGPPAHPRQPTRPDEVFGLTSVW